jgi:hypothetical protein
LRYAQLLHFNTGGDYIPTPPELTKKHRSLINIRTFNSNCFLYSCLVQTFKPEILKIIFPEKSSNALLNKAEGNLFNRRLTEQATYEILMQMLLTEKGIDFSDFCGHVDLENIERFEERFNLSIIIISYEDGQFYPTRLPKQKRDKEIHLLELSKWLLKVSLDSSPIIKDTGTTYAFTV